MDSDELLANEPITNRAESLLAWWEKKLALGEVDESGNAAHNAGRIDVERRLNCHVGQTSPRRFSNAYGLPDEASRSSRRRGEVWLPSRR